MDRIFELSFADSVPLHAFIEAFTANAVVEFVEPVGNIDLYIEPLDDNFGEQWYHKQPNDVDFDSPEAWDFDTNMVFTKIAVIDTGIDSLHPELRPNLWKNTGEFIGFPPSPTPDFLDNDGNGYVDDIWGWDAVGENGSQPDGDPSPGYTHLYQTCSWTESRHAHGTRVAGSLMSVDNNFFDIIDKNIVGVIWHGSIMNVKCVSDYGASNTNTYAAGIQYAAQAGADILSMSWGFIGAIGTLGTAVNYADALGVVMVAAVSYDPSAEGYPAGDIRTISVGGIEASGAVAFPHILFDTSAVVARGMPF